MKKVFAIIGLLAVSTAIACSGAKKADKSTRATGRNDATQKGGPNDPLPTTTSQANVAQIWGPINVQATTLQDQGQPISYNSNDVSRVFLGTDWPWKVIGSTTTEGDPNYNSDVYPTNPGCKPGINCAVGMTLGYNNNGTHAPLSFSNGQTLSQVMQSGQQVGIVNGGITMAFWDSLTGNPSVPDADGNVKILDPIPVWIPLVNDGKSYIKGNVVKLYFQDNKGSLTIDATISGGTLSGTINFVNTLDFNNTPNFPASGKLGTFSIPVSAAFR